MARRSAFTILELLLALALASIAIGSVIGLYSALGIANQNAADRFSSTAERTLMYEILQETMGNLVAATPITPAAQPGGSGSDRRPGVDDLQAILTGEGQVVNPGGGDSRLVPQAAQGTPVMFDLSWEDAGNDIIVQRMELVTLSAPASMELLPDSELLIKPTPEERERWKSPERVRAVYEFVYVDEREEWDLVWRPIEPPGYAVPIIEGVRYAQWYVLMRSQANSLNEARRTETWQDVAAAFLGEDFPIAVRLEFETMDGETGDWLFETLVITRQY